MTTKPEKDLIWVVPLALAVGGWWSWTHLGHVETIAIGVGLAVLAAGAGWWSWTHKKGRKSKGGRQKSAILRKCSDGWRVPRGLINPEWGWVDQSVTDIVPWPNDNAPAMLVVGHSGSGKTNILALLGSLAVAPVLVASTKPDLLEQVVKAKAIAQEWYGYNHGIVQVWDPSGLWRKRNSSAQHWDPSICPPGEDPLEHAHRAAGILLSDQQGQGSGSRFWEAAARVPLAHLLMWAQSTGHDVRDILQLHVVSDPAELLERWAGDPSYPEVTQGLAALAAQMQSDAGRRTSDVLATALATLSPWGHPGLGGAGTIDRIDVDKWAQGWTDVLGIVVAAHDAPLWRTAVGTLIDDAVAALRRAGRQSPAIIVIDEAANVAHLPALGTWATEVRAWGGLLVIALQNLLQAQVWSPHPEDWCLATFPRILAAADASELGLAQRVSDQAGWREETISENAKTSGGGWTTSYRKERRRALEASDVLRADSDPGRRAWVQIERGRKVNVWQIPPADEVLARAELVTRKALEKHQRWIDRKTRGGARTL